MSKRKDPRDEAIRYVMSLKPAEAAMFVQTLASIVKVDAERDVDRKAAAPKPAAASRTKAPVRDIRLTDPNKPADAAQSSLPVATEQPATVS